MKKTISVKMLNTLSKGKEKLSREAQERIRKYIRSQMDDCDFFIDKSGRGDVYYTFFGLMLSYVFGVKIDCHKVRVRLEDNRPDEHDLIHYAAYARSVMVLDLLEGKSAKLILSRLFSAETKTLPSFTKFPHGDEYSPYSVFVLLSLAEDFGLMIENKRHMLERLDLYRVNNGGFSNVTGEISATVNATAAALCVRGQLGGYKINEDVEYLCNLQDKSGGFFAAAQSPVPDLLSTATALFALSCYRKAPLVDPCAFIEAHWLDSGGFAPTLFEDKSDVEYTFYGVLA